MSFQKILARSDRVSHAASRHQARLAGGSDELQARERPRWVAGTDAREGKDASLSTRPAKGRSYSGLFIPGYLLL